MFKTTFISFIFHILFLLIFLAVSYLQPRYTKIPKDKIIRVKFLNLPKEQVKQSPRNTQPVIPKQPSPPKPTPKPPEKQARKKIAKPTPAPPKPDPTPKPTPKPEPKPKATPKPTQKPPEPKPRRTPTPQKTTPPPRTTPVPPSPNPRAPAPAPQQGPSIPMVQKPPLNIVQEDLPDYYLLLATQKIESNFKLTRSQRFSGVFCVVEFLVNKNGEISDIKVVKSTGQPSLDQFAVEAVERTETLGPLPDSINKSSISITATFKYSPEGE